MSDPYERAKGGRLSFKGGDLATRKSLTKKKKNKNKNKDKLNVITEAGSTAGEGGGEPKILPEADKEDIYSIDAAKKRKYDDLFPVEAKKFGYIPKASLESVEKALDDRVKKKADRYCK